MYEVWQLMGNYGTQRGSKFMIYDTERLEAHWFGSEDFALSWKRTAEKKLEEQNAKN